MTRMLAYCDRASYVCWHALVAVTVAATGSTTLGASSSMVAAAEQGLPSVSTTMPIDQAIAQAASATLAPAIPVLTTQPPIVLAKAPTETLGCFHYGYAYESFIPNASTMQNSTAACQAACKAYGPACKGFTWWMPASSAPFECDLALAGHSVYLKPTTAESGSAISGPPVCAPVPSACSGQPAGSGFPGQTEALSAAAFPGGHVPTNAQCWPRDPSGFPMACENQVVTVLEDTATGWPGKCEGLMRMYPEAGKTCEQSCRDNTLCSVWQIMNVSGGAQCWQGSFGHSCFKRPGFYPVSAQRIMHGNYRVLKNLKGIEVMGLSLMFSQELFPDTSLASKHCRLFCIANLACNYWIYSTVSGCWAENPDKARVHYPLILSPSVARVGTQLASAVVDGEFIQHYCGDEADLKAKLGSILPSAQTKAALQTAESSYVQAGAPPLSSVSQSAKAKLSQAIPNVLASTTLLPPSLAAQTAVSSVLPTSGTPTATVAGSALAPAVANSAPVSAPAPLPTFASAAAPAPAPSAGVITTQLAVPALAGDTKLMGVASPKGIQSGREILIGDEKNVVTSLGSDSMSLQTPLKKNHVAGTRLALISGDEEDGWAMWMKVLLGLFCVVVLGALVGAIYFLMKTKSKKRGPRSVVPPPQPSFDIEKDFQRTEIEDSAQPLLEPTAVAPTQQLQPQQQWLPQQPQQQQIQLQAQGQQPQAQNIFGQPNLRPYVQQAVASMPTTASMVPATLPQPHRQYPSGY